MFETGPVLWLQSLASGPLTALMVAVSALGYTPFYVGLVVALAFGWKLRQGLGVALALLLAGLLAQSMKTAFALPRPSDVDERVMDIPEWQPEALVSRGGAPGFWQLPTPEAITAVRARPDSSYGFPSGHVASAAAMVLALALLFRRRALVVLAAAWIPLMALSRMYLGRHFIADVLGGVGVGALSAAVAVLLYRPLASHRGPAPGLRALSPLLALVGALLIGLPLTAVLDAESVGSLLGLTATFALLAVSGAPGDTGSLAHRAGRVGIAALMYVASSQLLDAVLEAGGWDDVRAAILVTATLTVVATLAGGITLSCRLRLYRPATTRLSSGSLITP